MKPFAFRAAILACVILGPGCVTRHTLPTAAPGAIEVPFDLLDGRPYVAVHVNGQGPFRFIVDTGGEDLITRGLADRLGIPRDLEGQRISGAGERAEQVGRAHIATLDLLSMRWRERRVLVLPDDALRVPTGVADVEGMIGYGILSTLCLTIDYERKVMRLGQEAPAAAAHEARASLPFTFRGNTPQVEGEVDGAHGSFLLDTGDRFSLTLFRPFAEQNGLPRSEGARIEAVTGWGVGGEIRARVTRAQSLSLGGLSFQRPITRVSMQRRGVFARADVAGSIGYGLLARFRATFDYPRRRLLLDGPAAGSPAEIADRGGLWLNPEGPALRVVDIWPGGAAERAGILRGDQILAIDGRPAKTMLAAEARESFRRPSGTVVKVTLSSSAGERTVELTLRDPV
jgi:hypothetical protein